MIVRNSNQKDIFHVKFIGYSGKYPNLCRGILTLDIDGQIVKFCHDYATFDIKTGKFHDNNYDAFWRSSGMVDCNYHVHNGEWEILENNIPECYHKYIEEIDYVFNTNVPHGCCGGCS